MEIILATIKINYGNYGRIMALQIQWQSSIKRGNYGKQLYFGINWINSKNVIIVKKIFSWRQIYLKNKKY